MSPAEPPARSATARARRHTGAESSGTSVTMSATGESSPPKSLRSANPITYPNVFRSFERNGTRTR